MLSSGDWFATVLSGWRGIVALAAFALLIGTAGLATLPPDEHEVLVLQTTAEMHARGDWLVPYFNGRPRLNKPPMSYWATAAIAGIAGAEGQIKPWHGRVPSLVAGLGLLGLLIGVGRRLYGPRAALLAGALFITSSAFFAYGHDARPDFLYAFFCSGGYLCAALVQFERTTRRRLAAYAMWLAYGLAVLTKGPHVPLMLLVASGIQWPRRRSWRELAPPGAVLLAFAVVVPWWLALHFTLAAGELEHSQLGGRLLKPSLGHLLNGYYLYRPLQLVLPWLPLIPIAWLAAAKSADQHRSVSKYLAVGIVCAIVGFSLGSQQRYFYLLPLLAPMCLIAGRGLECLLDEKTGLGLAALIIQGSVIVGALGWLLTSVELHWLSAVALAPAAAGAVLAALYPAVRSYAIFVVVALMGACAFITPGITAQFWSTDRHYKSELALWTARHVPGSATLVTFQLTPEIYVYAASRPIPRLKNIQEINSVADQAAGEIFVLMEVRRVAELASEMGVAALHLMPDAASDRAGLYRIETK